MCGPDFRAIDTNDLKYQCDRKKSKWLHMVQKQYCLAERTDFPIDGLVSIFLLLNSIV